MSQLQTFQIGDPVKHRFLGLGTVIKLQTARGGLQYLVQFRETARWLYPDNLALDKRPAQSVRIVAAR